MCKFPCPHVDSPPDPPPAQTDAPPQPPAHPRRSARDRRDDLIRQYIESGKYGPPRPYVQAKAAAEVAVAPVPRRPPRPVPASIEPAQITADIVAVPSRVVLCMYRSDKASNPNAHGIVAFLNWLARTFGQRFVHSELMFIFAPDVEGAVDRQRFQRLTATRAEGVNVYATENEFFRAERWVSYDIQCDARERAALYAAALRRRGGAFNTGVVASMVGCGAFAGCLRGTWLGRLCGCARDENAFFCAEVIALVIKDVFPDEFAHVEPSALSPDALYRAIRAKFQLISDVIA